MSTAVRKSETALRSDAIAIARVICICGIVYTHTMLGGDARDPWFHQLNWHNVLYWTVVEIFGRSSVPLLSIISGWLVGESLGKRGYVAFMSGKARTLLAPMVLWNAIALAVFLGAMAIMGGSLSFGLDAPSILNELFFYRDGATINVQNAFLRDVFVCMAAVPLLLGLPTRGLVLVLAGTAIWVIGGWQLYVLLRPQILLFFVLGILVRRHELDKAVAQLPIAIVAAAFVSVAVLKIWLAVGGYDASLSHPHFAAAIDNLMRFVAAMAFWRVALHLAESRLQQSFLRAEKYAFVLFCSHILIIKMMGPMLKKLGGFGDPLWMFYFLIQPLVLLLIVALLSELLLKLSRPLAGWLSGGRLIQERRPRGAPSSVPA